MDVSSLGGGSGSGSEPSVAPRKDCSRAALLFCFDSCDVNFGPQGLKVLTHHTHRDNGSLKAHCETKSENFSSKWVVLFPVVSGMAHISLSLFSHKGVDVVPLCRLSYALLDWEWCLQRWPFVMSEFSFPKGVRRSRRKSTMGGARKGERKKWEPRICGVSTTRMHKTVPETEKVDKKKSRHDKSAHDKRA